MGSECAEQSRILREIFETAKGFYEAGTMDDETFHEFEKLCKQPTEPKKKNDCK